ncbi:MAG: protein kinase [Candidatus Schekmanbacteria bacterium]|nr:protein kinase [Candidatus Schekmanbacteria bacterium]
MIGPYRVEATIGRGGCGVVYRAVHSNNDRRVALKTVTTPLRALVGAIRCEIHALARIRHPGIVRIVDEGTHGGMPWYAMELIDGRPLHQYVAAQGKERSSPASGPMTSPEGRPPVSGGGLVDPESSLARETLETLCATVSALCDALAFLHGEGMVHRDLKPSNILVMSNGNPVLLDFGLATYFAAAGVRERLLTRPGTWGTVGYMAPEQVRMEIVDARADLYALGCVLYELVSGRPPFVGGSIVAVAKQHLYKSPIPLGQTRRDVPAELDSLVGALLEKEPRRRIGYALDVAVVLDRIAGHGHSARKPPPVLRSYLYKPRLIGRERALEALVERCEGLVSRRRGGLIAVSGEPGQGKTRLINELAGRTHANGTLILDGRCSEGSAVPLLPLRRAMRAIAEGCAELTPEEVAEVMAGRAEALAAYEPAFSTLVSPGAVAEPPLALPVGEARERLQRGLLELFKAVSLRKRLLLVIEDLHWADELSLDFLGWALRSGSLDSHPLLIVVTYRPGEASSLMKQAIADPRVVELPLEPLGCDAVAAIVGDMLALSPPPTKLAAALATRSGGNPYFVAELLRSAVENGVLRRDRNGKWIIGSEDGATVSPRFELLAFPRTLPELIRGRLAGLGDDTAMVAMAMAVLARETNIDQLEALTGLPDSRLMEAVTELRRCNLLDEPEPGRLGVIHDEIRRAALGLAGSQQLRRIHAAAAELLERTGAGEESPLEVATHWEEAGEAERAASQYLRGARWALNRYATTEAYAGYLAYLRLTPAGDGERIRATIELADRVVALRSSADAVQLLETALAEATRLGSEDLEFKALVALAGCCETGGNRARARDLLQRAIATRENDGDRTSIGDCLLQLGYLSFTAGSVGEWIAHTERALAIFRESGDRRRCARALGLLAGAHAYIGATDCAVSYYSEALRAANAVGDRFAEAALLGNFANLLADTGEPEKARDHYTRAIDFHRWTDNSRSHAIALTNLGALQCALDEIESASESLTTALAMHRLVGDRNHEAWAMTCLGSARLKSGSIEEALKLLDEALAILRQTGHRPMRGHALLALAMAWRYAGDLEHAERFCAEAIEAMSAFGYPAAAAGAWCEHGHLALARGLSGGSSLANAKRVAGKMGPRLNSGIWRLVDRLDRAEQAFARGRAGELVRGEHEADIPAALLARLRQTTTRDAGGHGVVPRSQCSRPSQAPANPLDPNPLPQGAVPSSQGHPARGEKEIFTPATAPQE